MSKESRENSSSSEGVISSPYFCNLKTLDRNNGDNSLLTGDEKEWEEARCSICMDHPHNAALLRCSAWEKGCFPFICDTSYRHSNCLDQFLKSVDASSSARNQALERSKLTCPLCRGAISGWDVIQPARQFMNSKRRNCSLETCSFTGNYAELRKHARLEHPFERPSEANSTRQATWDILEIERDIEDAYAVGWTSWDGDDSLANEGFSDIPSAISDVEDEISQPTEEMYVSLPLSLFSLYSSSHHDS